MRMTFQGAVRDGKLRLQSREEFAAAIAGLEGKPITLSLERRKSIRSRNQNDWFHKMCELISDHTGDDVKKVKEILKQQFLLIADDGKYAYCRATSSLNTEEMSRFIEDCTRWAATELGVVIPDPDKEYR